MDQAEELVKTLAYTAGLIDGEGCLFFCSTGGKHYPRVAVQMTDETSIRDLKATFGGSVCKVSANARQEERFRWDLTNKDAVRFFLLQLLPYLRVKKVHARILLDFLQRTDKDTDKPEDYAKLMHEANSRGPGSSFRRTVLRDYYFGT